MTLLDQILAAKRQELERLRPRAAALQRAAENRAPARPFAAALRAGKNVALIAEFKRRSPSAHWIRRDGAVAEIAKLYSESGARAISVLTDAEFFGGSENDLRVARAQTSVPILRKDFILDPLQIVQARALDADAVLLIVRALSDQQLRDLLQAARALGLGALVETHDQGEIERALAVGADVIGINNRDLATFQTDLQLAHRLVANVPPQTTVVAESGVRNAEDVRVLAEAGVDAVLVGEALMRAPDLPALAAALANQPRLERR